MHPCLVQCLYVSTASAQNHFIALFAVFKSFVSDKKWQLIFGQANWIVKSQVKQMEKIVIQVKSHAYNWRYCFQSLKYEAGFSPEQNGDVLWIRTTSNILITQWNYKDDNVYTEPAYWCYLLINANSLLLEVHLSHLTCFSNQFIMSSCASAALLTANVSLTKYLTVHPWQTPGYVLTRWSNCNQQSLCKFEYAKHTLTCKAEYVICIFWTHFGK